MSWSIWQALRARDAAMHRPEPAPPPRVDNVPAPSPKVLNEIFRAPMPPRQEELVNTAVRVPEPKEAQVP